MSGSRVLCATAVKCATWPRGRGLVVVRRHDHRPVEPGLLGHPRERDGVGGASSCRCRPRPGRARARAPCTKRHSARRSSTRAGRRLAGRARDHQALARRPRAGSPPAARSPRGRARRPRNGVTIATVSPSNMMPPNLPAGRPRPLRLLPGARERHLGGTGEPHVVPVRAGLERYHQRRRPPRSGRSTGEPTPSRCGPQRRGDRPAAAGQRLGLDPALVGAHGDARARARRDRATKSTFVPAGAKRGCRRSAAPHGPTGTGATSATSTTKCGTPTRDRAPGERPPGRLERARGRPAAPTRPKCTSIRPSRSARRASCTPASLRKRTTAAAAEPAVEREARQAARAVAAEVGRGRRRRCGSAWRSRAPGRARAAARRRRPRRAGGRRGARRSASAGSGRNGSRWSTTTKSLAAPCIFTNGIRHGALASSA